MKCAAHAYDTAAGEWDGQVGDKVPIDQLADG
jgi:hypothetical protein